MSPEIEVDVPTYRFLQQKAEEMGFSGPSKVLRFACLGIPRQEMKVARKASDERLRPIKTEIRPIEVDQETYEVFATHAARSKFDYSPGEIVEDRYRKCL